MLNGIPNKTIQSHNLNNSRTLYDTDEFTALSIFELILKFSIHGVHESSTCASLRMLNRWWV